MATIALNIDILKIREGRYWIGSKSFSHMIWDHFNPENVCRKGFHLHHLDNDPTNDYIGNLKLLTNSEHMSIHNKSRVYSGYSRRLMSIAKKGENHPFWGTHRSEETKKKISDANKGKCPSEETRQKISIANKGCVSHRKGAVLSEETKRKISDTLKLKGCKNPMCGKHHTEEAKEKISLFHKGKPSPMLGRKHSEESKIKMSETRKLNWKIKNGQYHQTEYLS